VTGEPVGRPFTGATRESEMLSLAIELLSPSLPDPPAPAMPQTAMEALAQADAYFASPSPLSYGQGLDPQTAVFILERANQRLCVPPLKRRQIVAITERVIGAVLKVAS
jgi:hypothetical protein